MQPIITSEKKSKERKTNGVAAREVRAMQLQPSTLQRKIGELKRETQTSVNERVREVRMSWADQLLAVFHDDSIW